MMWGLLIGAGLALLVLKRSPSGWFTGFIGRLQLVVDIIFGVGIVIVAIASVAARDPDMMYVAAAGLAVWIVVAGALWAVRYLSAAGEN